MEARKLNSTSGHTLYLVGGNDARKPAGQMLYGNNGLFHIMVIVILFACLGLLSGVGLKIQNINYQKSIFELNEMISIEEDRGDRLNLEISSLKTPSRILAAAESELEMQPGRGFEVIGLSGQSINNNEKIFNYILRENTPVAMTENYDSLLGMIYYVQDIVLVVSESVLTFFIP
ncbi:MAG: hypothetical protein K8S14_07160 [Actinomycetia bacterium]|nr:hypothetical protein [Actinomycetes bacterium]